MDWKVKYSALHSADNSRTASLDGNSKSAENLPFLHDKLERPLPRCSWGSLIARVLPWLLVAGLSIPLLRTSYQRRACADDGLEKYSPLAEVIEYEDVVFKRDFGPEARFFSEYAGWPTDEIDRRWEELYSSSLSFIDAASHERLLNKSMRTPAEGLEGTYVVQLGVFHQLHCLDIIRQSFYPRRYNSSIFKEDGYTVKYGPWVHINHCIDILRQSLMCNTDVTALGFQWFEELQYVRLHVDSVHRCRNFDRIRDWAQEHQSSWTGHMAHVDEKTNRVIDYGVIEDNHKIKHFTPADFQYTKDDM